MKHEHLFAVATAVALACAGCAGPAPKPVARSAPVSAVVQPVGGSEQLWHLRAGLNVAALSCRDRGRDSVAPAYSRLLTRHRSLLAASYAVEQRNHGSGLDRHQTQLYNRFAMQRFPARFCTRAAEVAQQALAMDSPTLARNAAPLLARID